MPSSAPIGMDEMRVSRASRLEVCVRERLLDEQQAGFTHAFDIATGIGQGQPAIGVGAEWVVMPRPFRSASVDSISRSTALVPILSLKKPKPCARFACASAMSCSGVGLPRSHIGGTARTHGATNEIDQRQAR